MRLFFTGIQSLLGTVVVLLLCASVLIASAQTRTSPNYQLQSDSLNVGGELSSSAGFSLESTIGEVATGPSDSASFALRAGYQQMQSVFLSLSGGADVTMAPGLPGITGGIANGSTTFTIITDSPAGYSLTLQAERAPALQRADGVSIDNYTPVATADFAFVLPSASAEFGFTPQGEDVVGEFLDNGSVCGVGSVDTPLSCWAPVRTSATQIAGGAGSNSPIGATTSIHYRVGISNGAAVAAGVYTATTTVTALPL